MGRGVLGEAGGIDRVGVWTECRGIEEAGEVVREMGEGRGGEGEICVGG